MSEQPELPDAWKPLASINQGYGGGGGAGGTEGMLIQPQHIGEWKNPDSVRIMPRKSLVSKLAEVMTAVERIAKRGHNDHFNYDFATESDITAAIRGELASRQLIVVPHVETLTWRDVPTRSGSTSICCAMVQFTIYDGESGSQLVFRIPGEGQDSGDKCVPKALTSAVKYALLKLFLIPTGDDPERTSGSKQPVAKAKTEPSVSGPLGAPAPMVTRAPRSLAGQIKPGWVQIIEVQAGNWGKALGQVLLIDHGGVEIKYAVFSQPLVEICEQACFECVQVIAMVATPVKGGKSYLKDITREEPIL